MNGFSRFFKPLLYLYKYIYIFLDHIYIVSLFAILNDRGRNAAYDKNKHEETPERLTSGANPDENPLSRALLNEPFTLIKCTH